jgi:hypothetical protein
VQPERILTPPTLCRCHVRCGLSEEPVRSQGGGHLSRLVRVLHRLVGRLAWGLGRGRANAQRREETIQD